MPVLQSVAGAESLVNLNDIQDRTAQIVNGRAERRAAEREQKRASDYAMSRANLSGVTSPGRLEGVRLWLPRIRWRFR